MHRHSIANPDSVSPGQNDSRGSYSPGSKIPAIARWLGLPAALFLIAATAQGQEALRMSLAGEESAEQEKKASNPADYNLELGPVSLRFQAGISAEFNDNVTYVETDRQADVAFRPNTTIAAYWPMTEENSLYFSTTIGYVYYLRTKSLDRLFVTPDSNLSFKMYVSDFAIELHDRFSVTQDVTQNPTVSGAGFDQIENTIGVAVTWDLDKLILTFGYDHDTVDTTSATFSYLDRNSELFYLRASFVLGTTTTAGLETGGGLTSYDQQVLNNNTHENIGPFYNAQLSEYISTKLSAGYTTYQFSQTGLTNGPSHLNTFYADLSLTHRLNQVITYSLSVGRDIQLGLSSDTVNYYYARVSADWNLIRYVSLSSNFSYEKGSETAGASESFALYQGGFTMNYQVTKKLQTGLEYDLALKDSDLPGLDYLQNRLVLSLNYSF